MTEMLAVRVPKGTVAKLKLLAARRTLEAGQEVRWASIIKDAVAKALAAEGEAHGVGGGPAAHLTNKNRR